MAASGIKAGVTVMTKFVKPGAAAFDSYINYMDRDEAQRAEYTSKYNLYQDYMGNPEKTSSLFTAEKDLSPEERKAMKDVFSHAEENGSLMWQTVISFDNRWLKENGLMNEDGVIDEEKIKDVTRNSVRKMLHNENLDNAVWTAAIHYNTDNIHIHVATVEPEPMRKKKEFTYKRKDGTTFTKEEYVGRFKMDSIEKCKSSVVNQILREQETNKEINRIIQESILADKKQFDFSDDKELMDQFLKIYNSLPDCDRKMWNYNQNIMAGVRPEIDKLTEMYIRKYHKDDFEELEKLLHDQDRKYREAYGTDREDRSYYDTKIEDLYARMGNSIMKDLRAYDKELREIQRSQEAAQKAAEAARKRSIRKGKRDLRRDAIRTRLELGRAMSRLKKNMRDEYEKSRNEYLHEMMLDQSLEQKDPGHGYD